MLDLILSRLCHYVVYLCRDLMLVVSSPIDGYILYTVPAVCWVYHRVAVGLWPKLFDLQLFLCPAGNPLIFFVAALVSSLDTHLFDSSCISMVSLNADDIPRLFPVPCQVVTFL